MKKYQTITVAVLGAILVALIGYLVFYGVRIYQKSEIYEILQEEVAPSSSAPQATVKETATPEPTPSEEPTLVDFGALKELNEDVCAWIEIPGTEVAYPILQHPTDDAYYLNHTIERESGLPASIYIELSAAKDFSDFNTVIYGHDMHNDTMFGSLSNYRDPEFFAENREIVIQTEMQTRTYTIFAGVLYDDRYIPYCYDDRKSEDREAFLASLDNGDVDTMIMDDVVVTADSQIITLSTCVENREQNRYLIVAVYDE